MSVSPADSTGGNQPQGTDQLRFRFCRECSNLLYPKEDRTTNTLMFSCRTCHVSEPASSYCVFQNKMNSQVGDTAGVTQDVGSDPTVGLPLCALCGEFVEDLPSRSFSQNYHVASTHHGSSTSGASQA